MFIKIILEFYVFLGFVCYLGFIIWYLSDITQNSINILPKMVKILLSREYLHFYTYIDIITKLSYIYNINLPNICIILQRLGCTIHVGRHVFLETSFFMPWKILERIQYRCRRYIDVMADEGDIKNANDLKLRRDVYLLIAKSRRKGWKRFLYRIGKPPEESKTYSLSEVPKILREEYGLSKATQQKFLRHSNRITQKGRELAYTLFYAKLIDQFFHKEEMIRDVSVLVPAEDRGIDSYVRIVGLDTLVAILIQICEIKSSKADSI